MKTASLLAALGFAKPSLGSNDAVMPVLAHFCFMDDMLYAYNDITAVVVEEPTGLNCALHGETLIGILNVAGAEEIKVKMKDGAASLDVGNGWVKVPALPEKDFIFVLPDEEPILTIPFGDEIAAGIERCLMSVSPDALAPEFAGVTFNYGGNPGTLTLYSSDNKSATRYWPDKKLLSRKPFSVVIPEVACSQMLKLRDEKSEIMLGEKVGTITAPTRSATLITKLLPAKADQFHKIFAQHAEGKDYFKLPLELGREIAKASVLVGRESVKNCDLIFEKGKIVVSAGGVLGTMRTTIDIENKKVAGMVSMPPEMISRILPHAESIAVNDGASFIFIHGNTLTHIISSRPKPAAAPSQPRVEFNEEEDIPY